MVLPEMQALQMNMHLVVHASTIGSTALRTKHVYLLSLGLRNSERKQNGDF
jgi:hypothetical protein